jgi:hypothetical protein
MSLVANNLPLKGLALLKRRGRVAQGTPGCVGAGAGRRSGIPRVRVLVLGRQVAASQLNSNVGANSLNIELGGRASWLRHSWLFRPHRSNRHSIQLRSRRRQSERGLWLPGPAPPTDQFLCRANGEASFDEGLPSLGIGMKKLARPPIHGGLGRRSRGVRIIAPRLRIFPLSRHQTTSARVTTPSDYSSLSSLLHRALLARQRATPGPLAEGREPPESRYPTI